MSDDSEKPVASPHLTQAEAGDWLKVKKPTLEKWRIEGKGPPYREHGGIIVYHVDDLSEWSRQQQRTKTRGHRRKKGGDGQSADQ